MSRGVNAGRALLRSRSPAHRIATKSISLTATAAAAVDNIA